MGSIITVASPSCSITMHRTLILSFDPISSADGRYVLPLTFFIRTSLPSLNLYHLLEETKGIFDFKSEYTYTVMKEA